jgi:hypothetical protein
VQLGTGLQFAYSRIKIFVYHLTQHGPFSIHLRVPEKYHSHFFAAYKIKTNWLLISFSYPEYFKAFCYILYVDQNGKKVADSDKALSNRQNESIASLRSFKNAQHRQTAGSIVEQFNGTRMLITYQPGKLHSTIWAILLMRHSNDS